MANAPGEPTIPPFTLTPEVKQRISLTEIWRLTREEAFPDTKLLSHLMGRLVLGVRVRLRRGTLKKGGETFAVVHYCDNVESIRHGSVIWFALFGECTVTYVGRPVVHEYDNMEFYLASKLIHRWAVTEALAAGRPVPANVLADYPDLQVAAPASA